MNNRTPSMSRFERSRVRISTPLDRISGIMQSICTLLLCAAGLNVEFDTAIPPSPALCNRSILTLKFLIQYPKAAAAVQPSLTCFLTYNYWCCWLFFHCCRTLAATCLKQAPEKPSSEQGCPLSESTQLRSAFPLRLCMSSQQKMWQRWQEKTYRQKKTSHASICQHAGQEALGHLPNVPAKAASPHH